MRYIPFGKGVKIILYAFIFVVCFLLALIFYNVFIDTNQRGFEVFETFAEWILYLFLISIFCGVLLSLANAFHEVLEDRIILRFGVFGFVHIKYSEIKEIEEFKNKNIPVLRMGFSDSVYYGYLGRENLVKIKLKGEANFYYLFFKKRRISEIIFSVREKQKFLEEIKKRQEK